MALIAQLEAGISASKAHIALLKLANEEKKLKVEKELKVEKDNLQSNIPASIPTVEKLQSESNDNQNTKDFQSLNAEMRAAYFDGKKDNLQFQQRFVLVRDLQQKLRTQWNTTRNATTGESNFQFPTKPQENADLIARLNQLKADISAKKDEFENLRKKN